MVASFLPLAADAVWMAGLPLAIAIALFAMAACAQVASDSTAGLGPCQTFRHSSATQRAVSAVVDNVEAFLCNSSSTDASGTMATGMGSAFDSVAHSVAEEIAAFTATAVVNGTAACYDNSSIRGINAPRLRINGATMADSAAGRLAEMVAEAAMARGVCGPTVCELAEVFAEKYAAIFLPATAAAEATLSGNLSGQENAVLPISQRMDAFVSEVVDTTVPALSQVLAGLWVEVERGCKNTLSLLLAGGDLKLDGGVCSSNIGDVNGEAVAELVSYAASHMAIAACSSTKMFINNHGESIGLALAIALEQIPSTCNATGVSRVCELMEAKANATAEAVAIGIASEYAADDCERGACSATAETLIEVLEPLLINVTSFAISELCRGPGSIFNVGDLQDRAILWTISGMNLAINATTADTEGPSFPRGASSVLNLSNTSLAVAAAVARDNDTVPRAGHKRCTAVIDLDFFEFPSTDMDEGGTADMAPRPGTGAAPPDGSIMMTRQAGMNVTTQPARRPRGSGRRT